MENPLGVRRARPTRCVVVSHANGKQGMIQYDPILMGLAQPVQAVPRSHDL